MKILAAQVKVMQEAISSLCHNNEKTLEKQTAIAESVQHLSDKFCSIEQEQVELKVLETKLTKIFEKHKETIAQHDKKIKSIENKMKTVGETQSNIEEQCQLQETRMKEHKQNIKIFQKQMEEDFKAVHENIQTISSQFDSLEADATDFKALKQKLEKLEEKSENLSEKAQDHDSSFVAITRRTDVFKELQSTLSEALQKLEEKITAMEMNRCGDVQKSEKLYNDLKTEVRKHDLL